VPARKQFTAEVAEPEPREQSASGLQLRRDRQPPLHQRSLLRGHLCDSPRRQCWFHRGGARVV